MSLGSALATAMSGLRANQAALAIVSSNIANAQTPGYVTQRINQVETLTGDNGSSVSVTGVNRELNQFIQAQLRSETSGGAYADQVASVLTQLQSVYGTPGEAGTLETAFANFTTALQSLSTNSGSSSAQISAVTAAQSLAQQLNATTQGIQALRSNAEQDINISVGQANAAMTQIAQINQLAASMASALSDKTTDGTVAPAALAPKAGFDLDLSNLLPGNTINLTYTDTATNTQHQVTIVRVDDPAALPLSNAGNAPNHQVIGVNFSGGMASVVSQLNSAFGAANLQFSNPVGSTLRVLDNGTSTATVNAASVTTTVSSLASGSVQLPVFTDANLLYTGWITQNGSQQTGLAGRIKVNTPPLTDPSKLTVYNTSPVTSAGDTTRPDFLYSQLTSGPFTYSPHTCRGTAATPVK